MKSSSRRAKNNEGKEQMVFINLDNATINVELNQHLISKAKTKIDITTPPITQFDHNAYVEHLKGLNITYTVPKHYVKFQLVTYKGAYPFGVRYNLSTDDMEWFNSEDSKVSSHLKAEEFEILLNIFEKEVKQSEIGLNDTQINFTLNMAMIAAEREFRDKFEKLRGTIEIVYQYWLKRRRKKRNCLMREFQPPPEQENHSPHVAFRPRPPERDRRTSRRMPKVNDNSSLITVKKANKDFKLLQALLNIIQKREFIKKDMVKNYL